MADGVRITGMDHGHISTGEITERDGGSRISIITRIIITRHVAGDGTTMVPAPAAAGTVMVAATTVAEIAAMVVAMVTAAAMADIAVAALKMAPADMMVVATVAAGDTTAEPAIPRNGYGAPGRGYTDLPQGLPCRNGAQMKFLPKLLVGLCLMAAATLMASTAARADSFQIGIGPHGGINFSLSTGGYCDARGCPPGFWDMPVYYCPVYYHGRWYRGPVYYRHTRNGLRFWIRGGWRSDRWRGPRPPWACTDRMGPPLGFRYYERHGFHMRPEWRKRWMHDHPGHPPRDLRHGHRPGHAPDRGHDPRHSDRPPHNAPHGKSITDHIMGAFGGHPNGRDDHHSGHNNTHSKPSMKDRDTHKGGKAEPHSGNKKDSHSKKQDKGHGDKNGGKHDDKPDHRR